MHNEKMNFLFGKEYGELLCKEKMQERFIEESSDFDVADLKETIEELAYYTREYEMEEAYLAELPDITEDTSLDSEEYLTAENVHCYKRMIAEFRQEILDMIPVLKDDGPEKKAYDAAVQSAIECHVLEEIKRLHLESCDALISQYREEGRRKKESSIQELKTVLNKDYSERIVKAKSEIKAHISEFLQNPIVVTSSPQKNRRKSETLLITIDKTAASSMDNNQLHKAQKMTLTLSKIKLKSKHQGIVATHHNLILPTLSTQSQNETKIVAAVPLKRRKLTEQSESNNNASPITSDVAAVSIDKKIASKLGGILESGITDKNLISDKDHLDHPQNKK